MDSNEDPDMVTLETCLSHMIESEEISFETAKAYARNPAKLKMQDEQTYAKSIQLQKDIGQQSLSLEEKKDIRLLVIDSNEKDRGNMINILRRQGYEQIASAETGKEGINKIRSLKPQIVVLDLHCHDVDSFKACKWIKEQEDLKIKVVLIATSLLPTDAENVKLAQADDFIIKTINFELLCKAIEKVYRSSNKNS